MTRPSGRAPVAGLAWMALLLAAPAGAQSDIESAWFSSSDGVSLHYLEAGEGPLLVLVPGWTMPASIWEPQIRYFSASHRVVAFDPRGQGRSEKVSFGYTPSRRALDMAELIDHLEAGPAIVAGWSLGMQEVMVMTHEQGTEDVRAVVLVDHLIDFVPGFLTDRYVAMQTRREEWMRMFVPAMYASQQPADYLESIIEASLATPESATAIMIGNLVLMGPTDLRPALDALDRPVLFITSSQDWAVEQADMVREGWPDVRVVTIPDTGHALFVDKPDEFNRELAAFIASLP